MGLDLNYFWSLDVTQWIKHVKMFNKKENDRLKELDMFNYMLGKYVAWAVNDPKHYPKQPFTSQNTSLKPMTDEEMERQARRNTIRMGGVINDS